MCSFRWEYINEERLKLLTNSYDIGVFTLSYIKRLIRQVLDYLRSR